MIFGKGGSQPAKPTDADAPAGRASRSGPAPLDFMAEPEWTSLASDMVHRRIEPGELSRLPRRHRDFAYRVVAHLDSPLPVEEVVRWYQQSPSGTTAGLVGAAKVRQARRIRGTRRLAEIKGAELDRYTAVLADAESFLHNAVVRFPDAVLPWVPRIDIARGLKLGLPEVAFRRTEAEARERWNFLAAEATFLGHCNVWAGSYQDMFVFADVCRGAPYGHPTRSIPALAEAERLMRDPKLDLNVMPARELIDLHDEFELYVGALREPLDPDDIIGLGAFLAVVAPRDAQEAARVLKALDWVGRRCGGLPYAQVKDPLAWFTKVIDAREAEARRLLPG